MPRISILIRKEPIFETRANWYESYLHCFALMRMVHENHLISTHIEPENPKSVGCPDNGIEKMLHFVKEICICFQLALPLLEKAVCLAYIDFSLTRKPQKIC